ncbi:UNVERIFIED_CONTAM: hypothetical protein Sindi_2691100 [Sesamum indicum]
MQIRPLARAKQDLPREQSPPQEVTPLTHEQVPLNGEILHHIDNLLPRLLGEHSPRKLHPRTDDPTNARSFACLDMRRIYSSSGTSPTEEEEQRREEVNNKISRLEVAQTQGHNLRNRESSAPPAPKGVEDSYLLLTVAPPRRSPFAPNILTKALPAGLKVSNLSEYDGTGDSQEYLDKFYADLSDSAYCKNLLTGRFKESIAGKPPSTMEDLLIRSQKYIRIEETNTLDPSLSSKRKGREEEKELKKKEELKHVPPAGFAHYTPLNAPRGRY